ncbi:MAG TPA: histidinol dehydrogenase, partial [Longimicrobiales bacterium]|nr:histidinol dehydrogenase [Longimicrobiales bacterium]
YPSSVLMGVVPARVAGVAEVIVCSPPGPSGIPSAAVLAACAIGGADRVFALGGAGAIAALARGTETVPRVDKIVGPGNAYVNEAKRQLSGVVAIDSPAGPSEILILADESAVPDLIALELMAQAEHDPDAAAVLVATSELLVTEVVAALHERIPAAPRGAIVRAALAANGALLVADSTAQLFEFAESYAPEHLLVLTRNPREVLERVGTAGTIFLGASSSVAFGDYITGANHTLPTAGRARAYSGLSTLDFVRWFTYQQVDAGAAAELAETTGVLADAEGLPAHAEAARARAAPDAVSTTMPSLRAAYRHLRLYDPQRAPCEIDLSDNTNLFGVPPSAAALIAAAPADRITRYPSVFAARLKEAVAAWFGVVPDNVATGCGSDDVIDSALRAFCEPGDRVVFPDPTFSMVGAFAEMNALEPVPVSMGPQLQLDVAGLVAARGRITYVCRPNNPTGTSCSLAELERLAARVPGVLLVDEAYADFAEDDCTSQAAASERTISLRTLSKAFGMAGLRVGLAIGPPALIAEIEKSRGPYKVNHLAEAAGIAALTRDGDWVRERVSEVRANRARLSQHLQQAGYRVLPSGSNFLLLQVPPERTAATLAANLRSRGVAVRPFPALPQLGDCIRVTIGPWSQMERFLSALATS